MGDAGDRKLFMNTTKLELSTRYYVSEVTVWLLGAILIVSRFSGVDTSQPVPVLKIILDDKKNYILVLAALLIFAQLYLYFEWKQSSRKARESSWSLARVGITTLFACVFLWLSYPLIAVNTGFAGISPGWFLGFLAIGFFLGYSVSFLVFSSLLIRTPTEAKALRLPRLSIETRGEYIICIPVIVLLLVVIVILRINIELSYTMRAPHFTKLILATIIPFHSN